jgi:hypothetical protein
MGVEYRHHLIPSEPLRRPSAERVAKLVRLLESEGWLLSPKSETFRKMVSGGNFRPGAAHQFAKKSGGFYLDATSVRRSRATPLPRPVTAAWLREHKRALEIEWPFENVFEIGARYPLTRAPYVREWVYFSYELHWSRYLLEVIEENVESQEPRCVCGEMLALRKQGTLDNAVGPFFSAYRIKCSRCGLAVDPTSSNTRIVDVETGESRNVPGGAFYRFALVVDCGKSVPESGAEIAIEPALVALVERTIGCAFHQIGAIY